MEMISAVSGTSLIYFRKVPPVGNRNSAIRKLDGSKNLAKFEHF
jgi:hypothetical protein